ncbi:DNA polymerase Y family protein [Mucilaginibacter pallidiroseus]|uniref:DNA polymerase Y family protein n=1 Tax=Mucilaginibacter pallidiroseus TaxID=2599295 RepID=A0A563U0T1_9SPHI|nr:DNA polymerase Y family protein [Mucilaginibacter pallidiroseus]TWR25216.1 DNA polymerase Y family protein [Mucilaginibacter pallidiroseus]
MQKRFVSIWFRYLKTDWLTIRRPELKEVPFVFTLPDRGRIMITAANKLAEAEGAAAGMPVADAKAVVPGLQVFDDKEGRDAKLLKGIGEWCIKYTPIIAIEHPDGLVFDITGCAHIWGGERAYLKEVITRIKSKGYDVRAAMADTAGAAFAIARFGRVKAIIEPGGHLQALMALPTAALRLDDAVLQRLKKLGLHQIKSFVNMPRSVLRRRFGEGLLLRLGQALGYADEVLTPLHVIPPYYERLPCLEPIRTATGIEIAITRLLEALCTRLQSEGNGMHLARLTCYRVDGKVQQVQIGTNRATYNVPHLFKLFELKIAGIAPALGIELFVLEALKVEEVTLQQDALWAATSGLDDAGVIELLDRLAGKVGAESILRYLPNEHYWPERSIKKALSLQENPATDWRTDRPRPTQLLARPEPVEVSAPIPDYPPMLFIYKGKRHAIKKADGPERIEREWWIDEGEHRDYYNVEDENGCRYWLFRSGHYAGTKGNQWFIHGFFA